MKLRTPSDSLPRHFELWLRGSFVMAIRTNASEMRKLALMQLKAWRDGDQDSAFPGYSSPPADDEGSDAPAGWTEAAFERLRKEARCASSLDFIGLHL